MDWAAVITAMTSVALRKESVDRNPGMSTILSTIVSSLSARRAWIEMQVIEMCSPMLSVALRKESVDRNTSFTPASLFDLRRSPQGERG